MKTEKCGVRSAECGWLNVRAPAVPTTQRAAADFHHASGGKLSAGGRRGGCGNSRRQIPRVAGAYRCGQPPFPLRPASEGSSREQAAQLAESHLRQAKLAAGIQPDPGLSHQIPLAGG